MHQAVEEFPCVAVVGRFDPDEWGVDASPDVESGGCQGFSEDGGVGHVVVYVFTDVCCAFFCVESFGSSLCDVAWCVVFGVLSFAP